MNWLLILLHSIQHKIKFNNFLLFGSLALFIVIPSFLQCKPDERMKSVVKEDTNVEAVPDKSEVQRWIKRLQQLIYLGFKYFVTTLQYYKYKKMNHKPLNEASFQLISDL